MSYPKNQMLQEACLAHLKDIGTRSSSNSLKGLKGAAGATAQVIKRLLCMCEALHPVLELTAQTPVRAPGQTCSDMVDSIWGMTLDFHEHISVPTHVCKHTQFKE